MRRFVVGIIILWFLIIPAYCQQGEDQKKQVEALVEQLGDKRFKVRQEATKTLTELVSDNESIVDILEGFKDHKDPEIRLRLNDILGQVSSSLKPIDLAKLKDISSGHSTIGVQVEFQNKSKKPIKIYWIDWNGERKPWRGVLKPGDSEICEKSYETHVWLITDENDKPLALYVLGKNNTKIKFKK